MIDAVRFSSVSDEQQLLGTSQDGWRRTASVVLLAARPEHDGLPRQEPAETGRKPSVRAFLLRVAQI
jgi:hypothetical protein